MKSLTAGKGSRMMSGVFVACLVFAAHGAPNVFDDAVFWFRGGKDIGGDGYMQKGEFFDDLHANDNGNDNHKMPMTVYTGDNAGYKVNAAFGEELVSFPALGLTIKEKMRVLRISNVKGNSKYFPFVVNPYSIFASNNISTAYTIVTRIKVGDDGKRDLCLFRIGYDDSSRKGLYLALGRAAASSGAIDKYIKGYCTPDEGSLNSSYQFNIRIPTNTWVDVAAVVGNGKLRVGIAAPESSSNHDNNPTIAFAETPMWTENCTLLGDEKYRLFCANGQKAPATSDSADQTCFIGSVQQMAIWGRALSDQEVMEAVGMPRPAIFRTGFDNGNSNEFGGTRSGSTQEIDGLGSWQNVSDTMQAGDTWTVNFDALRDETGVSQIFSLRSLPTSTMAKIEPVLNGTSLGVRIVGPDARVFWPVASTNVVSVPNTNTLTIRRVDNYPGEFRMDAMELGGALGIGTGAQTWNDGKVASDLNRTGVPSAADPNMQHWSQGLRPKKNVTNLLFRVWVDPDVVNVCPSRFRAVFGCEPESKDIELGDEKFTLFVNGNEEVERGTSTNWEAIAINFDAGKLLPGWNDIELKSAPSYTNCCWPVSYYRFETVLPKSFSIPPSGLMMFVR